MSSNSVHPELEFGDNQNYFKDPREGLISAGSFSLRFGRAHKSQVRLGLVGPSDLLADARHWYKRCEREILTGKPKGPMYLDFQDLSGYFSRFSFSIEHGKFVMRRNLKPR